jgi:hypothetical protein
MRYKQLQKELGRKGEDVRRESRSSNGWNFELAGE